MALFAIFSFSILSCSGGKQYEYNTYEDTASYEVAEVDAATEATEVEKQEAEKVELERLRQEQLKKERLEAERLEAEQKKKEWNGANSRTDLKSKLDGTTWETVRPYAVTNLYYRFEIKGNKVIWSSAFPSRNYDDPKDWSKSFTFNIYDIAEPRQGTYCVILKAPDEDAIENAAPTILVFKGRDAYYSLGGEMGPALKKVK